ncbi:MAG TPA: peroxiredoxin [Nitrososphaeraceae archaeon]|jgi:peroxiredoxin|nr:peroxiredoxin [Nitrososphaeraceae archaeon]
MSNSEKIPNVGDTAPDFELVNEEMKSMKLSDIKDKKVILAFFPAAESPVCTAEMCNFRDYLSDLNNKNAQVIGISIDGPFANKFFKENHHLNFPLLSDYNREVIKKYNVVMKDLASLKDYNAAKRSIFILDKDRKIQYKWVSDNPLIEPNYKEIMDNLK